MGDKIHDALHIKEEEQKADLEFVRYGDRLIIQSNTAKPVTNQHWLGDENVFYLMRFLEDNYSERYQAWLMDLAEQRAQTQGR